MFKFSKQDLLKYNDLKPNWGAVGAVTYKRTYARPIFNELGDVVDRENWLQTCVRVIEGNMNLVPNDPTATREWALEALDMMYNMGWLPPGRGLWMMGTEYAEKRGGDALNNCWYCNVRPYSYENMEMFRNTYAFTHPTDPMPSFPFVFMFDRAMLGGGVGFGSSVENIKKFPHVRNRVDLKILLEKGHIDWDKIKNSPEYGIIKTYLYEDVSEIGYVDAFLEVSDSREGWDMSIRECIDAHWADSLYKIYEIEDNHTSVCFDLSEIRAYGTDIKGFGGTSSGPLPLICALININNILNHRIGKNLSSVDALDIMTLLGRCVVAGNVRRTALISLSDTCDEEFINAKNYKLVLPVLELDEYGYPIWETINGESKQKRKPYDQCIKELGQEEANNLLDLVWKQENHRWASNNTVIIDNMFEDFHFITAGMIANGEPGIFNKFLSQNYGRIVDGFQKAIDLDAEGTNPCGEITLCNGEPCNLVELIPYVCHRLGYNIYRALEICTQYAYRITFARYSWPVTQRMIQKNRRIGVSIDGIQDYYLAAYGHYAVKEFENGDITKPVFYPEVQEELDSWYKHVKETNIDHAKLLGSVPSIKLTTMKPSGTVSKIPGVSAGQHFHYAPYLIQRIRFHETDPNLKLLKMCGYPIEKSLKEPNTMVVEFPVKAPNADHPNFKCSGGIPLEEQFANQYLFALMWADNAVSATLTFQSDETDKIEPLLMSYKNKIKSTSLLPYAGHGYVQAPWQPIDKEEYERRVKSLVYTIDKAYEYFPLIETGEVLEDECSKGVCPIR